MPRAADWTSPRDKPEKIAGETLADQRSDSEKPPLLDGVKVRLPTDKTVSTVLVMVPSKLCLTSTSIALGKSTPCPFFAAITSSTVN